MLCFVMVYIYSFGPGQDVAQKILMFSAQTKREICILAASGSISNASLCQASSSAPVNYEVEYL